MCVLFSAAFVLCLSTSFFYEKTRPKDGMPDHYCRPTLTKLLCQVMSEDVKVRGLL